MTLPEKIERLEGLLKKATPGPWRGDMHDGGVKYAVLGADGLAVIRCDHKNGGSGFVTDAGEADAALVIETVNTLPDLLSALRRMDEALEFYADELIYEDTTMSYDGDGGSPHREPPYIMHDAGAKARAAREET